MIFLLLITCCLSFLFSQNYAKDKSKGIKLYNQGKCVEAKKMFQSASKRSDTPKQNDLNTWIKKCNNCINSKKETSTTVKNNTKKATSTSTISKNNTNRDTPTTSTLRDTTKTEPSSTNTDKMNDEKVELSSATADTILISYDQTFTVNGVSFNMVFVEGGTFTMGATKEQDSEAYDDEKPTHSVTLSDYYIGETEVTQALWKAVMGSNPSYFKGDNLPVENVSYGDVQAFITKLNQKTGKIFRLPTEAEWEYAARGGKKSKGYEYSGSNNIGDVAWYYENSGDERLNDDTWNADEVVKNNCRTHTVKTKQPNELGIYDMSGNVGEWCYDWYGEDYTTYARTNPKGPTSGSRRVFRGSFFACITADISGRGSSNPSLGSTYIGFRLALGITTTDATANDVKIESSSPILSNQTFTVEEIEFTMVAVEGGRFTMESSRDGDVAYIVTLSDYYIGETEVTQALWKAVMGNNPSYFKGDNLPVEQVSYEDVKTFITKLNQKTGKTFRLPTEAEWEYAARGGKKSRDYTYSGSANIGDVAWYYENSGDKLLNDDDWEKNNGIIEYNCRTHTVKTKLPNELGIYDMSGNVEEWCSDWYGKYTSNAQTNPQGPSSGSYRVYRGGSWFIVSANCRVFNRGYDEPSGRYNFLGFRLALSK